MKADKEKHKNTDKFKEMCQQGIKKEPPIYLMNSLKQGTLCIDVETFKGQDVPFLQIMMKLSFNRIALIVPEKGRKNSSKELGGKPFYQTPKFRQLLKAICHHIEDSLTIKSFTLQGFPINTKFMNELKQCLQKTKKLKELCLKQCALGDQHLEIIKGSLSLNQSLIAVDLSNNFLEKVGGMIGKVLSQHCQRRNQIIWMHSLRGEVPEDDISSSGICQVNLSNNLFNDQTVSEMLEFLKDDNWTRCLNLRGNKITQDGVRKFALLLKRNTSLISLDLRDNPGLSKQYSKYIYQKLVANMEKYRSEKKKTIHNNNPNITSNSAKKSDNYKSLQQSRRKSVILNKNLEFSIRNNATMMNFAANGKQSRYSASTQCQKCKQSIYNLLRLEKRNLDLQLQLRKVRHILLTRNIDISVIFPQHAHHQQNSVQQSFLFNRQPGPGQEQDLLVRMEQVMNQLTRIMQTIQNQQHTQTNLQNPLSNPNSLSNTIPLFSRADQLQLSNDVEN